MRRALELARRGIGLVEPNPAVGAVILDEQRRLLGEGWHGNFGGPHAEVMALRQAGEAAAGATLFVTLEPCAHHGKTPPCTQAVITAGIRRVVAAVRDPAVHGTVSGVQQLQAAGVEVDVGLCADEAAELIAPFTTLVTRKRPYVHAKWAMTLDGKLATRTGHSQWISNAPSREVVHTLRGRMDAIIVGIGTALRDDPLLTARPPGPRIAARIVLDAQARLPLDSQLIRTLDSAPVIVATSNRADPQRRAQLVEAGAEVLSCPATGDSPAIDIAALLEILGDRRMSNVLVEGGSQILGSFRDQNLIDEVHCFVAPKVVGGAQALSPMSGNGADEIPLQSSLIHPRIEILGDNVYLHGRLRRD